MALKGLGEVGHFGVPVSNIERSLAFYSDLLGMEELARFEGSDDVVRSVVGYPNVSLKTAHEDPKLRDIHEVIEYMSPEGRLVDPQPANPGTTHLTFFVNDLQQTYDDLVAAGVQPAGQVTDIPGADQENGRIADMPHLHRIIGGKSVYMRDPDGIRVEFIQRAR